MSTTRHEEPSGEFAAAILLAVPLGCLRMRASPILVRWSGDVVTHRYAVPAPLSEANVTNPIGYAELIRNNANFRWLWLGQIVSPARGKSDVPDTC